jgi:hypothetical protein
MPLRPVELAAGHTGGRPVLPWSTLDASTGVLTSPVCLQAVQDQVVTAFTLKKGGPGVVLGNRVLERPEGLRTQGCRWRCERAERHAVNTMHQLDLKFLNLCNTIADSSGLALPFAHIYVYTAAACRAALSRRQRCTWHYEPY